MKVSWFNCLTYHFKADTILDENLVLSTCDHPKETRFISRFISVAGVEIAIGCILQALCIRKIKQEYITSQIFTKSYSEY